MPIDVIKDQLLTAAVAVGLIRLPGHARPHPSCLSRWHGRGIAGVRLECVWIGGKLLTTEAALREFFSDVAEAKRSAKDAGTTASSFPRIEPPGTPTRARRRASIDRARRTLDAAGI